jgi:Tol biopolymer transport system component
MTLARTVVAVVFFAPLAASQTTTRVSVDSSGRQANSWSDEPSISDDGRYVVFASRATNLVSTDLSSDLDVFLHDVLTGQTSIVSISTSGANGHDDSFDASISGDGRFVVFESLATNLVAGDTNGTSDVFVRDRATQETTRVSVDSSGIQANDWSDLPAVSADGRWIVFQSGATNLVPGDTNGTSDVFLHDRATGATTRVSVASDGAEGNGTVIRSSFAPAGAVSSDGRFVAFDSSATNLVLGDTNGADDVFVHDVATGATTRVSVDSAGHEADGGSTTARISADGRFVAFFSTATNLVIGDTNRLSDVFVHDRETGVTTRVSVDSVGGQANGGSGPSLNLSATGRFVAFDTVASNLVYDDNNRTSDVYLHDRETGQTTRVSVDSAGRQSVSNYGSYGCDVSSDGRFVAFGSYAGDLVPGDTNTGCDELNIDTCEDVFLRDREPCAAGTVGAVLGSPRDVLSVSGRTRLVTLARGVSFDVSLAAPPAGPANALYVLWIWSGFPSRQHDVSGGGERLGCTVNPTPFDATLAPQPLACLHATAVRASACGAADVLPSPSRAPWSRTRAGFSRPTRLTLQGLVRDNSASNALGVSVTNAVFVDVP